MYPLHLNYTTTLLCKIINMKITIFCIEIKRKHGNLTFQTVTADPVSSTRLQISLTVSSFQFFSGYFASIARYPSLCSHNVWILIFSSMETLLMTPAISQHSGILVIKYWQLNNYDVMSCQWCHKIIIRVLQKKIIRVLQKNPMWKL